MKKLAFAALIVSMSVALFSGMGFAAENQQEKPIVVRVDFGQVSFPDAQPFIDPTNGRTMVPVRFVSRSFGINAEWDGKNQTVKLNGQGKKFILKIGDRMALVDGKPTYFDASAIIKESRTFVPLRFVSEVFGAKVSWLADQRMVYIDTSTMPVKDLAGANIPIQNKDPYYQAFHKSLKIKNGVVSGVVPKTNDKNLLVSLSIWFKKRQAQVIDNGGTFSFKATEVRTLEFLVLDRSNGKVHAQYGYFLPSLHPIKPIP